MSKNNLLLNALKGESVSRPPVWMMRQAGRYLPEFMELRKKYDFFTTCQTPELASEITMQPIRRFPLDAAILFSDILVVPQAMGINFQMKKDFGPYLENPIRTAKQINELIHPNVGEKLSYVFDAVKLTKEKLNNSIPLLGFAGTPWTILCYTIEGKGSKTFEKTKQFCFTQPKEAHRLLEKISLTTIEYLTKKIEAGVDAVQLFDSWGGILSPTDYLEFSWPYIDKITEAIAKLAPVIIYAKGCSHSLEKMSHSKASALGIDWTISPTEARKLTNNKITLQGNFDPTRLYSSPKIIKEMVHKMIQEFGKEKYIVNLGHGILPNIPIENAEAFIKAVTEYDLNKGGF
jgi:uroporphyrinogen decarboxylase